MKSTIPILIGPDDISARVAGNLTKGIYGINGGTAIGAVGVTQTSTGTGTAATQNYNDAYRSWPRTEVLVTTASTTAVAAQRISPNVCARVASGIVGGFHARVRGGPATGVAGLSTKRYFMGLRPSGTAIADVDPATVLNTVGVGYAGGDTNMMFMTNNGTGNATEVDLGSSFPVPSSDRASLYEFSCDTKPGESEIRWRFRDLITGATVSGVATATLPVLATPLTTIQISSVGGTSSVTGIAVIDHEVNLYEPWPI